MVSCRAMKDLLRRLFSPVLAPLERGSSPFEYKPSHRLILIVMSLMFLGLAAIVVWLTPSGEYGYLLPVIVFGGAGCLGLVIGALGNDRAVARIWGTR